jgi:WD40 repeat protein
VGDVNSRNGEPVQELRNGDPAQVGPYRILGRLGAGGMGRVYLGRSAGGRLVAVKVIKDELAADLEFRARFRQEVAGARLVSGLFTAPVVDADLDGPVPWLATGYVEGPSLAGAVASHGPLPADSVLALAAALAEGLAAIHAAEVVHRDLKPSNVLLAPDGPRIIDFGIARAAEATALTQTGLVLGSPGFMSPEQAEGSEVGPPSDVFSLGAVLTFAATGSGPFGTGYVTALMYRVVHNAPDLEKVPGRVRDVIRRCLDKDPARRPTPAGLLAELGAANLAADWLPDPFTRARHAAPMVQAIDEPSAARHRQPRPATAAPDWPPGLAAGGLVPRMRAKPAGSLLARLDHEVGVRAVLFTQDGTRIATVSGKTARLWNRAIEEVAELRHQNYIVDATFSSDSKVMATRTGPSTFGRDKPGVRLWDAVSGQQRTFLPHRRHVVIAGFAPDGTRIATASDDRYVRLWDPGSGAELGQLRHRTPVEILWFSADGNTILVHSAGDLQPVLWPAVSGREAITLPLGGMAMSLEFSPDGRRLITFTQDGVTRLWDTATGVQQAWRTPTRLLDATTGQERAWTERMARWAATFSPDSSRLATAGIDHVVRIWDPLSGHELTQLPQRSKVTAINFSPDSARLVTVGDDNIVRGWNSGSGEEILRLAHEVAVTGISFSPDSSRLITTSADHTIRLWDLASGTAVSRVQGGDLRVFSPDRTLLATGRGPVIHLVDLATGTELARIRHEERVQSLIFDPEGAQLATRAGRSVALWAT